jgi:diguanylate cyclase (GGDEF)-like protein
MSFGVVLFVLQLALAIATALVLIRLQEAARHVGAKGRSLVLLGAAALALALLSARGLFAASIVLQSDAPEPIGLTEWGLALTGAITLAVFATYGRLLIERFELHRAVEALAHTDDVTGAFNKDTFFTTASPLVQAAQRYRHPLTALVVDINQLRRINDEVGRAAGEQSLRMLGSVLGNSVRQIDVIGKLGGEKFAIVLPHTDLAGASVVVTRIRAAIEREIEAIYDATDVRISASVGVAALHDGNLENLLSAAEGSIYSAQPQSSLH